MMKSIPGLPKLVQYLADIDDDVDSRIAKASAVFGRHW